MPTLRVDDLSFAYPGMQRAVLKQISVEVPGGEFLLLAGPSGCGKSTLALAMAGIIPSRISGPMRGKVYLGDECITGLDIHETSQRIGMVFQNPDDQLIHLDVESEVAFGPENLGLPRDVVGRRVEQALRATKMEAYAGSPIYALSGGQKQRIAISAALAMEPEVLVLDEPTSDLDPVGTQEVLEVIRQLNRSRQMTVILIEHKIDEVIPWVDRVLLMDEGKIVVDDGPRRVFQRAEVWDDLGVSIPEMVRLSSRLPDVFSGEVALSVQEAYDAMHGSGYHQKLVQEKHSHVLGAPEHAPLLEWRDIELTFPGRTVLKHLDLAVHPGEWVALVGPNGSGKTSLASLAMGFQAPTHGEVRFRDRAVKPGNISAQAAHIGYLFQAADTMLFASKVRDEILFGKRHQRRGNQTLSHMSVEELASLIDLTQHLDDNPFQLSHGQRKRLAIGALLAANPSVLILDEPTTGQDEGHSRAFLRFLEVLRRKWSMTFLMITHDMRAVARYASRVVVLNDGKSVLDGPPPRAFACAERLAEANIEPPPIAQLHGRLCHDADWVATDLDVFTDLIHREVPA